MRILVFSRDGRTILTSPTAEDYYLWESAIGKPRPTAKKDDERFLTDWLATSGQASLLRCEDGVGIQFGMLLTGKIDRFDQIPGLLGSSIYGRRVLVRTEKDKLPCLRVLAEHRQAQGRGGARFRLEGWRCNPFSGPASRSPMPSQRRALNSPAL